MKAAQKCAANPLTNRKTKIWPPCWAMRSYWLEGPMPFHQISGWMFVFVLGFRDRICCEQMRWLSRIWKLRNRLLWGEGWYNDAPACTINNPQHGLIRLDLSGKCLEKKQYQQQHSSKISIFWLIWCHPSMFSRDGENEYVGRSICYRFAATAPFIFIWIWRDRWCKITDGWEELPLLRCCSFWKVLNFYIERGIRLWLYGLLPLPFRL